MKNGKAKTEPADMVRFLSLMEKQPKGATAQKYNWPLLTIDVMMLYMAIAAKNQPAMMFAVQNLFDHLGFPPPTPPVPG